MAYLKNNEQLRSILNANYPTLSIKSVIESGQRVVYFANFEDFERYNLELESNETCCWSEWGNVVLKISQTESATELARMESEVKILKDIDSPHYPKIYFQESITSNPETEERLDYKYFVTIEEHIESIPLSTCMLAYQSEDLTCSLGIDLIHALIPLWGHSKRYVHRDLKPDNILVQPDGNLVIIDLGIARETGSKGVTKTAFLVGPCTPLYASPEQIQNRKSDITYKSDFFTLGVLLYEVVTGTHPFKGDCESLSELIEKTLIYTPVSPYHLTNLCSEELSRIIMKLLEKEPHKRFRKPESVIKYLMECKDKL